MLPGLCPGGTRIPHRARGRSGRGGGALSLDDLVVTASGCLRPIRWIGHRAVDCSRHPRPESRAAGARREGRLRRRPAGAEISGCRRGTTSPTKKQPFMPISALVNGVSVSSRSSNAGSKYWHVELWARHPRRRRAAGASRISTRAIGPRSPGRQPSLKAHPDFKPRHWADTCLPLALEGRRSSARGRISSRV